VGKRLCVREKELFLLMCSWKVLGRMSKKKVGGMKPPHPTEVLRSDVFLFVGFRIEHPLATFGLGNHNITGFVLPVGAFVVIP
jgi:hypothetical protein